MVTKERKGQDLKYNLEEESSELVHMFNMGNK